MGLRQNPHLSKWGFVFHNSMGSWSEKIVKNLPVVGCDGQRSGKNASDMAVGGSLDCFSIAVSPITVAGLARAGPSWLTESSDLDSWSPMLSARDRGRWLDAKSELMSVVDRCDSCITRRDFRALSSSAVKFTVVVVWRVSENQSIIFSEIRIQWKIS